MRSLTRSTCLREYITGGNFLLSVLRTTLPPWGLELHVEGRLTSRVSCLIRLKPQLEAQAWIDRTSGFNVSRLRDSRPVHDPHPHRHVSYRCATQTTSCVPPVLLWVRTRGQPRNTRKGDPLTAHTQPQLNRTSPGATPHWLYMSPHVQHLISTTTRACAGGVVHPTVSCTPTFIVHPDIHR